MHPWMKAQGCMKNGLGCRQGIDEVRSHGWMAWATHGMDKGMGKGMKVQAVAWACTAMNKGARVHETWPRAQVMHR